MKTTFTTPNGFVVTLTDAQEMAKSHPETLWAPSEAEMNDIQTGDFVKLTFNDLERMWVEVTNAYGEQLTGKLADEPTVLPRIKFGDRVVFRRENVYSIMKHDKYCSMT
jgi:uncharacterized protein YegJ (DUF2314 family)